MADADFYEYFDSETLGMVRVHRDNFVLRAGLEKGPLVLVSRIFFLDEAITCGTRGSPLAIQPSDPYSVLRPPCVVHHNVLTIW